jgi:hypothetical protein
MSAYNLKDFVELFPDIEDLHEFDGLRLETLRSWDVLAAVCACGHFGVVNRALLLNRHENHYLRTLQPRLRCAGCKQRETSRFWIGRLPR